MPIDRATLLDLLDYTDFTWASYGRSLRALPEGSLARQVEGSGWDGIREPLFHIAAAWDGWLIEKLTLEVALDATHQQIASWDDLERLRDRTRGWFRRALDETPDDALSADERIWQDTPAATTVSKADVFWHILLHERGHHGDIATMIHQLGGDPPNSDYLIYRFFKSREQK